MAFDDDREQVLRACKEHNVTDIVIPAISNESWQKTIDTCRYNDHLHLALGLHPMLIKQHEPQHLIALDALVSQHKPCAIGEIGLDFYKGGKQREKQHAFFSKQLIIAKQHSLPAIIHIRKAHDECLIALKEIKVDGGIIHNFNGSIQHAQKYIDLGFMLGFGGMLTFSRSRIIRNLAKQIPLNSIVLETDAPDLTVEPHKGHRNSPEYLPIILRSLAQIKEMPIKEVARITSLNAKSILNLS